MEKEGSLALDPRLTLNQHHKTIVGFMIKDMAAVKKQLALEGVEMEEDDLYTIADAVAKESIRRGYYVLDTAFVPEPFDPCRIPATAKQCWLRDYRPCRSKSDMRALVAYIEGKDAEAAALSEEERVQLCSWRRQEPVVARLCIEEGCQTRFVVTCADAYNAIVGNSMLDEGDVRIYQPSSRCMKHRREISAKRRADRVSQVAASPELPPPTPETGAPRPKWKGVPRVSESSVLRVSVKERVAAQVFEEQRHEPVATPEELLAQQEQE